MSDFIFDDQRLLRPNIKFVWFVEKFEKETFLLTPLWKNHWLDILHGFSYVATLTRSRGHVYCIHRGYGIRDRVSREADCSFGSSSILHVRQTEGNSLRRNCSRTNHVTESGVHTATLERFRTGLPAIVQYRDCELSIHFSKYLSVIQWEFLRNLDSRLILISFRTCPQCYSFLLSHNDSRTERILPIHFISRRENPKKWNWLPN